MLALKRPQDLLWQDLAWIELPQAVRMTLGQAANSMGANVIGLNQYRSPGAGQGNGIPMERLLTDIENGQIFLVNSDTAMPAVQSINYDTKLPSYNLNPHIPDVSPFKAQLENAIRITPTPEVFAPSRQAPKEESQENKKEKKKKEIKKHMIQLQIETEKGEKLPLKKYVTLVVMNESQSSTPVKQIINVCMDQDSRLFKAEESDSFKVYAITDRMKSVKDDLRKNKNLNQSESENKIEALEVVGTENGPDNVKIHKVKYVVPNKYLEIELLDEDDNPEPFAKYQVVGLDGYVYENGNLNENGYARVADIEDVEVQVIFPDFDQEIVMDEQK